MNYKIYVYFVVHFKGYVCEIKYILFIYSNLGCFLTAKDLDQILKFYKSMMFNPWGVQLFILVGIANVIAWPLAYYGMRQWLENFAYRIDLSMGIFVLGGMLALLIALLAVGQQTLKATLANPVDSLRQE